MIRCRVTENDLKLLSSNDMICMTIYSLFIGFFYRPWNLDILMILA